MSFTSRDFRDAFGSFATGVTIVTATAPGGQRIGLTVSSFNSVSLEPALVLFSVGRESESLDALLEADAFAVNVLSDDQTRLSIRFADTGDGKWDQVEATTGVTGAPLIAPVLASFECEPYGQHDGGDHVIFVGRVVSLVVADQGSPLVFYRGQYHQISKLRGDSGWFDASMRG